MIACDLMDMDTVALTLRIEKAKTALHTLAEAVSVDNAGAVRIATVWPMYDGVDEATLAALPGEGPLHLGCFLQIGGALISGYLLEPAETTPVALMRCELIALVALTLTLGETFLGDGGDDDEDGDDDGHSETTQSGLGVSWGRTVGSA